MHSTEWSLRIQVEQEQHRGARLPLLRSTGHATIRATMNTTRQREHWDHPIELGDEWTLRKNDKMARCTLVTHPLGWELRLMTTDLLRSQVCRSSDEILDTVESWKAAMLEGGWCDMASQ
jgi:hypothetical protein